MDDLKQRTVRGGFAKLCAQGANLALRVGSLMVLARLLDPADFGLVAMVTALTGVLALFKDFGLSTATVQRSSVTKDQISTLFWINVLVGAVLTCLTLAAGPLIAHFYREPRLLPITAALAASFLVNAIGVQHSALLEREMRFTTLAAIESGSLVTSVAVAIAMALYGLGYWALVGMSLAGTLMYTLCVWATSGWVPGAPARRTGVRSILRFGGIVTMNSVVVYVAYNLEKVLLGRVWGADALGIYGRAYQLISIPTDSLNSAVGSVAFSALARVSNDADRLRSYFIKGYSFVVALTLPVTVLCALFADDLIFVVLGPRWSESAPIFRLLAPTILVYAMINPLSWLLLGLGRAARSLKIALVLSPLVIASYVVGLPYGPTGVALGFSTAMILWLIPHLAWCVQGGPVSLKDLARAVTQPLFSALCAAAFAWGAVALCPLSSSHLTRLVVGAAVLLVVYVGVLFYVMGQRGFYSDLVRNLIGQTTFGRQTRRSPDSPGTQP